MNKQKLKTGAQNPVRFLRYVRTKVVRELYLRRFNKIEVDGTELDNYEQFQRDIHEEFEGMNGETRESTFSQGTLSEESARALKGFVKDQRPNIVVETGVCNGMSSLAILEAINDTGSTLYSVDLPEFPESDAEKFWSGKGGSVVPPGKRPGWAIPDNLRDNWELRLGNSLYRLPDLMEELDKVDIFVHDSEHSYEMMMFEFCLAWKQLKHGGYLICDDHSWNNAFHDFAREKNLTKHRIGSLGLIQK